MARISLSDNVREASIGQLAHTLIDLVDLEREAKQAHWNVRGRSFIALHELFDAVATEIRGFGDTVAERLVMLGGFADGTSGTVAKRTLITAGEPSRSDAHYIERLADLLANVGSRARQAIDDVTAAGDAVSADVLTEVTRGLDKQLWLIEAHAS